MYARSRTSDTRTPDVRPLAVESAGVSAALAGAAFEIVAEFTFKVAQAGLEQFPFRDDDDVEPWRELVVPEDFPDEALCAVSHDGTAQLPCRRDAEATDREAVGESEQRETAGMDLDAAVVDPLVLGPLPDALTGPECC